MLAKKSPSAVLNLKIRQRAMDTADTKAQDASSLCEKMSMGMAHAERNYSSADECAKQCANRRRSRDEPAT